MSFLGRFRIISNTDKSAAARFLVEHATPDFDFFFMIVLSVVMACFGLLMGSESIVIGSMLIAPLLYPVIGVSMGISMGENALIRRSVRTVLKASAIAIAAAFVTGLFASSQVADISLTSEILLRTEVSLLILGVAFVSGLAVSYALVRPRLSETLAGIAISVALLPPLAVIGLGLSWLNLSVTIGALSVFLLNIGGIIAAALIIFSLMNLKENHRAADAALARENARIKKEEEEVKRADAEE